MGGGSGILSTAMSNLGNPGVQRDKRLVLNLFDPGGTMGTLTASTSEEKGYQTYGIGEDPNIKEEEARIAAQNKANLEAAPAQAAEQARLDAIEKRRKRTRTLLSEQDESPATTGKKVLLGG